MLEGPPMASIWLSNMMVLKLIQVCLPIRKFKLLVSLIKRETGVLEQMVVLSTREAQTEAYLKGMGWNLIA